MVLLAANSIGFTAVSGPNGRLVRRLGARRLLRVGLGVMAGGSATLGLLAVAGLLVREVAVPLVFVTVSSLGLIAADATALAVARAPRAAGSASAILGALQLGLAATVSPLVGLGGENTAVAMAVPIAVPMVASTVVAGSAVLTLARTDRDTAELSHLTRRTLHGRDRPSSASRPSGEPFRPDACARAHARPPPTSLVGLSGAIAPSGR